VVIITGTPAAIDSNYLLGEDVESTGVFAKGTNETIAC